MSVEPTAPAARSTWRIDPVHTIAEFEIQHMRVSVVKGRFTGVEGIIVGDLATPSEARIEVMVPAERVDTGYRQRDVHLRSEDFLDCERFPEIRFKSSAIDTLGEGNFWVRGTLELHGIAHDVTLICSVNGEAQNYVGEDVVGITAETTIVPSEFGLSWNVPLPGGGFMIGDSARIEMHIEAVRE